VQQALTEKNEELSPDRCMVFRIGVHLGDIHEQGGLHRRGQHPSRWGYGACHVPVADGG
jgi:hypothetical protein